MPNLLTEVIYTVILFVWVIAVVQFITRKLYDYMVSRGMPHNKAVYYNRKLIHIAAGGFVALLVPFLYETPLLPSILAMILALFTYLPHRQGKLLYWFQVEDNMYEVNFCIMWGIVIALSWIIFHNLWYGVIPVSFMAFGDAATGVVRNILYGKRTKSWYGNLAMLATTLPIGLLIGLPGVIAAIIASIIEHFEFKGIDDNVMVPLSSFLVILGFSYLSF
ncbi:MAG: dolichol kinase [Desulfurococcales archaeon]|nr:dolichol kinase [Desulfurococcales archaeon]